MWSSQGLSDEAGMKRLIAASLFGPLLLVPLFVGGCKPSQTEVPTEVRQLVTFDFLPGRSAEAIRLFREKALPLYEIDRPMLRFRAYREVESPEPVDLVVVSSFQGMEGMDDSNRALAEGAQKNGTTLGEIYGRIESLSAAHRDEFAEIDPSLSWGDVDRAKLLVLVSIRLVPGGLEGYRTLLREELVSWERKSGILSGGESGVYLVSNGFRILRTIGIDRLEDWHRYQTEFRRTTTWRKADQLTAEEKEMILAPVPELAVR
jgi:hypothetical protein